MSITLFPTARHWLAQQRPAVIVELASVRGSAPRERGARMLVAADLALGSIGGGHLEYRALAIARERLAAVRAAGSAALVHALAHAPDDRAADNDAPLPHEQTFALGPSLGQCCGGSVTLRFTLLDGAMLDTWPTPPPRFHLQLHGAGHVGRAVSALLAGIACRVQWIDVRDDAFDPSGVSPGPDGLAQPASPFTPHIEHLCSDTPEAEVNSAPPGACYLVLTHDHALDLRIVEAVLRRGDFAYCGLIGSATKRTRFVRQLEARGVATASIARLVCPVGVPGIAGKEPEIVAIAVVAQLLAVGSDLGARRQVGSARLSSSNTSSR